MTTIYIDRKDASLSHDRSRLWIRFSDEKYSVLVRHVDRIVISAKCVLDSQTLLILNDQKIPVVIMHPRKNSATWCGGWHHGNTERRITQYNISQDRELCTRLARKLVKLKLIQQKRLLQELMPSYPAKRRALFSGYNQIAQLIPKLNSVQMDEVRGMEGAGSRIYFKAYSELYPKRFNFTGRNKRPPKDPVNACLSLSYTLLMSDAIQALYACGLDPSIGYYHLPAYNRDSLACDLIETVRSQADHRVLNLFRSGLLDTKHFVKQDNGVYLNKEGRSKYYAYWEENAHMMRRRLRKSATSWAKLTSGVSV